MLKFPNVSQNRAHKYLNQLFSPTLHKYFANFQCGNLTVKIKLTSFSQYDSSNFFILQLYVVGGSSCPSRPCLRILSSKKQKLKPFSDFSDKAVRNAIVRASVFDEKSDAFFTGSEEGFICCWKPGMFFIIKILHPLYVMLMLILV